MTKSNFGFCVWGWGDQSIVAPYRCTGSRGISHLSKVQGKASGIPGSVRWDNTLAPLLVLAVAWRLKSDAHSKNQSWVKPSEGFARGNKEWFETSDDQWLHCLSNVLSKLMVDIVGVSETRRSGRDKGIHLLVVCYGRWYPCWEGSLRHL